MSRFYAFVIHPFSLLSPLLPFTAIVSPLYRLVVHLSRQVVMAAVGKGVN